MKKIFVASIVLAFAFISCQSKTTKIETKSDNETTDAKFDYKFSADAPFYDINSHVYFKEKCDDGAIVLTEADLGIGGAQDLYLYPKEDNKYDVYTEKKGGANTNPMGKVEIRKIGDYIIYVRKNGKRIEDAKVECNGGFLDPDFFLGRQMLQNFIGEYKDVNFPDKKLTISENGIIDGFYSLKPVKIEFQKDFFGAIRNVMAFDDNKNQGQKVYFEIGMSIDDPNNILKIQPVEKTSDPKKLEEEGEMGDWAFVYTNPDFIPEYKRVSKGYPWISTDPLTLSNLFQYDESKLKEIQDILNNKSDKNDVEKWNLELIDNFINRYGDEQ